MSDRTRKQSEFLAAAGWAQSEHARLAGDASNRRYARLRRSDGARAVLMDAPPEKGEDVRPFVRIAKHLSAIGLSAPRIFAQDPENGFLVLEDLGDDLFARVVAANSDAEAELYQAAIDTLIALHKAPTPELDPYTPKLMTDLASLAFSRYAAGVTGHCDDAAIDRFKATFEPCLAALTGGPSVLIQRDYHAENLLWLPDRQGVARVGLLDFQDAMLGHPAYDIVSILQDARRDVPPQTESRMLRAYIDQTDVDGSAFEAAYAALGVQRNLRIIGVFARLSLDHGKSHYVDFIPRVWGLLHRNLAHPALAQVAPLIRAGLPKPTPDALNRLIAA